LIYGIGHPAVSWECDTITPQIKGIQRIHKLCIPLQRDASKCTPVYIEMHPGKVVALQKPKPLSSKQGLSLMPNHGLWFTNKKQAFQYPCYSKSWEKVT